MIKYAKNIASKILIIIIVLFAVKICVAQTEQNDTLKDLPKPKFYNPLSFSGLSLQYAICAYPGQGSNNHEHTSLVFNPSVPEWTDIRSAFRHEMRSELDIRMYFSHQLFNKESFLYGNFYTGMMLAYGNRLNLSFISEYSSFTENGFIDDVAVTEIDTSIVRQMEYMQNTVDVGISIAYALSSPPQNDMVGEIGIGAAFLYSVRNMGTQREIYSLSVRYLDQYNKNAQFGFLETETDKIETQESYYGRIFVPASFSYRFGTRRELALSSFLVIGAEIHYFSASKTRFVYPYYTLGLGLRWFL